MGVPDMADEALELRKRIAPILAGKGSAVQGAVILDLLSIWLAGHNREIRGAILTHFLETLPSMVSVSEKEMFGDGPRPEGWGDG